MEQNTESKNRPTLYEQLGFTSAQKCNAVGKNNLFQQMVIGQSDIYTQK